MKLLKRKISTKNGSGSVLLLPETSEDLWHAYNLLQVGDEVRTTTVRKVMKESSTGSTTSHKVKLSLTIQVTKVDFDTDVMQVRLSGPNCQESDRVSMGAHHTLALEVGRNFHLQKDCWDQVFLDRLDESCHPERGADLAVLLLHTGLAHLCLVTGSLTIVKAKIETTIPKKRTGSSAHAKAILKFYEAIYLAILRHVDFTHIKCLLCASPGHVKEDLLKYIFTECIRRDDRMLIQHKAKFVLCRASSGHLHALEEVFSDPDIVGNMTETKVAKEVNVLNRFMRMMDTNPDKAYYGYQHVSRANDDLAIESLLVTDELFRSSDIATRRKYVALVESVRDNGGQVHIFSSLHVSGKQLQQVSGVAAILRYPMPDLETDAIEMTNEHESHKEEEKDSRRQTMAHNTRIQEDMNDMGLG